MKNWGVWVFMASLECWYPGTAAKTKHENQCLSVHYDLNNLPQLFTETPKAFQQSLPSGRDTLSLASNEQPSIGPLASISEEIPLVLATGPRSEGAHTRGAPVSPSATGVINWSSEGWMGSLSLSPASRELVESIVVQPGLCDSKAIRPGWKGGWNTLTEYLQADNKEIRILTCCPTPEHLCSCPH